MTTESLQASPIIGDQVELEILRVANGGFCIARHEGKVVFVRHSLPGERVLAEITDITAKFYRADAIEILRASEDRVEPPCQYSQQCGGCDWQHATLSAQLELKSAVVREQLGHLGKVLEVNGKPLEDFLVEPLTNSETGLRWRTRNRYASIGDFGVGMRMPRSHSVIEIDDCLIAVEGSVALAESAIHLGEPEIQTAQSSTSQNVVVDSRGGPWLDERVADRSWRIHASSFWQVHKDAPAVLVETVRKFAALQPGQSVLDLYSGSALFAASLCADVGERGNVVAVESSIDAVRDARRSCSDLAQLDLVTSDVNKWLSANKNEKFDVVVLDPPRAGAGAAVIEKVANMAKYAIVYVACDPSSLARDTALLANDGWSMRMLRGFDAFPMTSHVECVAAFVRQQ
jgi:tRNA/tmRNA/rRNA uracil-C5-methylase (TrmA/RlmC/RlmD family)